ncbi:sensor histidine kinase [Gorillibacterium sp. sgz5001074]|uniref:sensor histidine kinase n=1 Tax=Gorillibacterium sp. sgz5001074 TaxID=3446695 RepID=UPI003F67C082
MSDAPHSLRTQSALPLWVNPEFRSFAKRLLVMTLVLIFLAQGLWWLMIEHEHQRRISRDLSVIGQLALQHPEWSGDIARAFAREASPEEMAAGEAAARAFGLDRSLPLRTDRDMTRLLWRGAAGLMAAELLLAALLLGAAGRSFRTLYRTASTYAHWAERIVEGDFRTEWVRPAEGVFAKLAHQFQLMSNRMELTLERLRQEKEAMERLLSDISHQLKTPLAALQMFIELAQDDALPADRRNAFLAKGEAQIGRMDWLIRQLLTVARLEAGSTRLEMKMGSLLPSVQEAAEAFRARAVQLGVELSTQYDPGKTYLLPHDSAWLGEALGNLIKNALEHTPAGGRVQVRLEETSVLTRVVVTDTGEGIPPEELPRVFERFYKGRSASPGGGTGIGLSLAKAIVEQHGGFLSVRSTPGAGSVFTATLPRKLTES